MHSIKTHKTIKQLFILICFLTLITACKTSETSTLFNGKNLNGWAIHGTEKWYIENDLLVCENGPDEAFGYLRTVKNYKNFELNLEFNKSAKGNSGVFVHSQLKGTQIKGWQIELAVPNHFTGGVHEYQRGWLIKPDPNKDSVVKIEEWNQLKIRLENNKLTTWINGTQMSTLTDEKLSTSEGAIAFQIHNGNVTKVKWRAIKLIEL